MTLDQKSHPPFKPEEVLQTQWRFFRQPSSNGHCLNGLNSKEAHGVV